CRLDGESIKHLNGADIISDGISYGAIQVPGHGKPIIMLSDRQYILKSKEEITDLAVEKANMKLVPKNTVVMSFKLSIGRVAILK
ncbi:hypothetical protein ACTPEM_24930, partial [Clostridioides difficile]